MEKCEIIMQRSMNEDWECDQKTGEMVMMGFMGDGGASEFSNYYCETHEDILDTWELVKAHRKEMAGQK